jgi:hypothetical protein
MGWSSRRRMHDLRAYGRGPVSQVTLSSDLPAAAHREVATSGTPDELRPYDAPAAPELSSGRSSLPRSTGTVAAVDWYVMCAAAASRDLWVAPTGPTAPEYGVWHTPSGKRVDTTLATVGPPGVEDVEWWFMPLRGHRGKRLVDAVWQYGVGLKVYSERMCAVMESCGARLQTWPADVRLRDGTPVDGYLAVLEEVDAPGPVHSMWRGRRTGRVAISGDVRSALVEAGTTGLEILEATSAFPGDHGFYDPGPDQL